MTEDLGLLPEGFKTYKGVDEETTSIISTYISANAELPIAELVKGIIEKSSDMSKYRASMIASSEVTNAIEGTRYLMYKKEFGDKGEHEWQTAGDDKVGDDHEPNDGQTVAIGEPFRSGEVRPGERPNCRCTTIVKPPADY